MTKDEFSRIENYMQSCMADSAHDREHVYRVLYLALDIAETEPDADMDVLMELDHLVRVLDVLVGQL